MLKTLFGKYSVIYVLIIVTLQLWLVFHLQLFGDESFYWLEGQYLSMSYSELPGWTAWMIRAGTSIFGNNYFAVRIVSYVGFISIILAIYLINKQINNDVLLKSILNNIFLVLSVPLLVLVAVMALPDIWLIIFVVWIIYFFIKAIKNNRIFNYMALGLIIACSVNVHVRMWIWLFFSGLAFLICFQSNKNILKPVLLITLPVALLGMIPILMFNYQNEFSLFSFQFGQRHPWRFQWHNFSFILAQIVVITPIILWIWFKGILTFNSQVKKQPMVRWITLTAVLHLIFYVFMSVFVDGLRTTVHWLLISYIPVLMITSVFDINKKFLSLAIVTGAIISIFMLLYLGFNKNNSSNLQSRILDNSLGWQELSQVVNRLQKQHKTENLITDYFMTASELAFELNKPHSINVLPHEKNIKHGRQKQLQIMDMLIQNPTIYNNEGLLIVEDTSLKLQNKGKYYLQLCNYFKQLNLLESVNIKNSKKQFHIFKVQNNNELEQSCYIPPLFYVEQLVKEKQIEISGWVILHNSSIKTLSILSDGKTHKIETTGLINTGIQNMFPDINDANIPNNAFKITLPLANIKNNSYQFMAVGNNGNYYFSQNYFFD